MSPYRKSTDQYDADGVVTPERFPDVLAPSGMTQGPRWVEGANRQPRVVARSLAFSFLGCGLYRHYGR